MLRTTSGCLTIALLMPHAGVCGASSLTSRSPFLPPDFEAVAAAQQPASGLAAGPLELTGVYVLGGRLFANVRDQRTGQSSWLEADRPRDGLTLLGFNESANTCTIRKDDGSTEEFALVAIPDNGRPQPQSVLASAGTGPAASSFQSAGSPATQQDATLPAARRRAGPPSGNLGARPNMAVSGNLPDQAAGYPVAANASVFQDSGQESVSKPAYVNPRARHRVANP